MKQHLLFIILMVFSLPLLAQTPDNIVDSASATTRRQVLFETTKGRIIVELYNETPHHRDNLLKLVKEGYYDGILWHRVIADFMIQTGDSTTRHAKPGDSVGEYDLEYKIPAEIVYPQFYHKRGALAAAREGDHDNPERASSAAQFYIVYGSTFSTMGLDRVQTKLNEKTEGKIQLTPEIRDHYMKYGGTPHLDGQYTVFGEVVEGLNVVRDIDFVDTDDYDRPVEDVKIIKATLLR
ncbi:MAG: peptidylprolyl isomerase [Prevotella sp.]|nr:peptidylprolyl isomerase [Prevotella sp.]